MPATLSCTDWPSRITSVTSVFSQKLGGCRVELSRYSLRAASRPNSSIQRKNIHRLTNRLKAHQKATASRPPSSVEPSSSRAAPCAAVTQLCRPRLTDFRMIGI
ncbi:hypothetical protein D9M69_599760 [compost metagenome]